MKLFFFPLSILLLLQVGSVRAAVYWEARHCENCSEAQRRAIVTPGGPGERFAFSFSRNLIKRYAIEWHTEGRSPGYWHVYEVPMDADVRAAFDQIRSHWSSHGGLNFYNEYDAGGSSASSTPLKHIDSVELKNEDLGVVVGSVYDALAQANLMRDISVAVRREQSGSLLGNLLGNNWNVNFSLGKWVSFGLSHEVNGFALVWFSDGSRLELKWDESAGEYVYRPGSAYDAEDQQVMDESLLTACALCGREFSWNDLANRDRWANRTSLFGIEVVALHGASRLVCGRVNGGPIQCAPAP